MTPDLLCHNWLLSGSYILADGNRPGFPIQYVSSAFVELFGISAADCLQKKCGALVGIERIKAADQDLANVIEASRLSLEEARLALDFLQDQSVKEVTRMLAESTGSFVTLNRARCGRLLPVCIVMHALKHPVSEQSFAIGLQFDLSDDLAVAQLFDAIRHSEYAALKQRYCRLDVCLQLLKRHDVICFLHGKMEEVSDWPTQAKSGSKSARTGTGAGTETKGSKSSLQTRRGSKSLALADIEQDKSDKKGSKESLMSRRRSKPLALAFSDGLPTKQSFMDVLTSDGYVCGSVIGRGQCGTMSKVIFVTKEGQSFAMKCFENTDRGDAQSKQLQIEYDLLRRVHHPNIVEAKHLILADTGCGMVMELCVGCRLSQSMQGLSDCQGHDILGKIFLAVEHLHTHKLAHRDLKADNIVVDVRLVDHTRSIDEIQFIAPARGDKYITVKLVDFGSAVFEDQNAPEFPVSPQKGTATDSEGVLLSPLTPASNASSFHENRDTRILPSRRGTGGHGDYFQCDVFALGLLAVGLLKKREVFTSTVFNEGVMTLLVGKVDYTVERYVQALLDPDPTGRPSTQAARRDLPQAECWNTDTTLSIICES